MRVIGGACRRERRLARRARGISAPARRCFMFTKAVLRSGRGAATRSCSRRGFTLVEILAVIVILGIASAIIIPQIGTRDDMRARAAARNLVADLIYAQNLAISSGKVVYVRFDVANNKYSLITDP